VLLTPDRRELPLTPFEKKPLPKVGRDKERRGEGQLQKLLDVWRGKERPNAEPGFGLPEVFASLSPLSGHTVPQSEGEAQEVLAFWKRHGPLAQKPWLRALERTRRALGQGRPLSAYLADLERQIHERKEDRP
jgi:hypothetical protein